MENTTKIIEKESKKYKKQNRMNLIDVTEFAKNQFDVVPLI